MTQQQTIDTTASSVIPPVTGLAAFDLQVSAAPVSIEWDEAALDAALDAVLENYQGLAVTEDMVTGIKSEMAALNKLKDRLAASRKDIAGAIGAPLKKWEEAIRVKEERIAKIRADLDSQVKAFEEKARESRRAGVQSIINEVLADANLTGFIVPFDERWLNKAANKKDTRAAVESIVLREKSARLQAEQLERAKQDRLAWLEKAVKDAGQSYDFELPLARFSRFFDLATTIEQAQEVINATFGDEQARRHKAAAPVTVPDPVPALIAPQIPMPTADDDDAMPTVDVPTQAVRIAHGTEFLSRRVMNIQIAYAPQNFFAVNRLLEELRHIAIVTVHGNAITTNNT